MRAPQGSLASGVLASLLLHGALVWLARLVREPPLRKAAVCELRLHVLDVTEPQSGAVAAEQAAPTPSRGQRASAAPRRRVVQAAPDDPAAVPVAASARGDGPTGAEQSGGAAEGDEPTAGSVPPWSAPVPLASNEAPHYPRIARASGIEGEVVARLRVQADGQVADVQIVTGLELFQEEVMRALRRWHYRPALRDGRPVETTWLVRVPFSLR